jgi:hypothetical protein
MKKKLWNYPDRNVFGSDWDNEGKCCCEFILTDKDTPFRTFMHYSDPEARGEPITVFGAAKKGLFYNYDDRLIGKEWDGGWKIAQASKAKPDTARFFEIVLNHFHSTTDVDLQHVLLGVNRSNGFHYLVFGYNYTSKREEL